MIHKPDIKKHIQNKPKLLATENNKKSAKGISLMDGPIFQVAQSFAENMDVKYKMMIAGVIYLIISGIAINLYYIYKLITILLF